MEVVPQAPRVSFSHEAIGGQHDQSRYLFGTPIFWSWYLTSPGKFIRISPWRNKKIVPGTSLMLKSPKGGI